MVLVISFAVFGPFGTSVFMGFSDKEAIFINTVVDRKCVSESMRLAKYQSLSHGYLSKKH
jgi:hypothetical protein